MNALSNDEYLNLIKENDNWNVMIGFNDSKEKVVVNFEESPHLLVSGVTGKGKTEILKHIITSLLAQQTENVSFDIVDFQVGLNFLDFSKSNQVHSISSRLEETHDTLVAIRKKMEERMIQYREMNIKNIKESPEQNRHFIVIDNMMDLTTHKSDIQLMKNIGENLSFIANLGRAVGYHLIISSQNPQPSFLTLTMKLNLTNKICFHYPRLYDYFKIFGNKVDKSYNKLPKKSGEALFSNGEKVQLINCILSSENILEDII